MARTFSDGTEGQPGAAPESTLASGIAIGATSLSVQAGHGARFPASGTFSVRLQDATNADHFEIVDCSSRSTDTLTIGATTYAWDSGDKVIHVISKADLDAFVETGDLAAYQALSTAGGKELGYAEVTANQTGIGTSATDLTGLSVTVDCDGVRAIQIIGSVYLQQQTGSSNYVVLEVMEGATKLMERSYGPVAVSEYISANIMAREVPSAGSHTYKIRALTQANTVNNNAAANYPSFIQVIQLGT